MGILIRVPYDHRLEPIDEKLMKLIAERIYLSKGTNGYPTKEQFDRWCEKYNVDRNVISSVFAAMDNPRRPPRHPASPQNLLDIIPVMQKISVDGVTYQVTRVEQYADFSLVYVEIYTSDESETSELNVQLMLNVEPSRIGTSNFTVRKVAQTKSPLLIWSVQDFQMTWHPTNFNLCHTRSLIILVLQN
jgi:hypothetical protein